MNTKTPEIKVEKTTTFTLRSLLFQLFLIGLVVAFAVLAYFAHITPHFALDVTITKALQAFNPPLFDGLMRILTWVGYPPQDVILVLIVCGALYFFNFKKESIGLFISSAGVSFVGFIIKLIIARPRPDPTLIHQLRAHVVHDSFPSGHVLFFIGFFGFIGYILFSLFKKGAMRSILLFVCVTLILLIGPSRIYVGDHWFTDVLGAYIVGFLWLLAFIHLFKNQKIL